MAKILITGASDGLGKLLSRVLKQQGHTVYEYNITDGNDVRSPNENSLYHLNIDDLDILINNAGINIIDWLENFTEKQWDDVMDVNAKGIFMMTKVCLPLLIKSKGTVLNIVSNASHMPMTCSLAYNASKGAAHIMTLQLARELTRKHGITVFGISPNKLKNTGMTVDIDQQVVKTRGWSAEKAHEYQVSNLLAGEETDPYELALFINFLLSSKARHKYLTGCVIPYGA